MPLVYKNIEAQGTTVVSGGISDLIAVVVNTATASSVVTVFDGNTTTTTNLPVVATIDASGQGNFFYGCVCQGGIVVTMATATSKITVIYDQYPSEFSFTDEDYES